MAESFVSRVRRAEVGVHHHIAGRYPSAYANEMAWREDNRRISNGEQYLLATGAALTAAMWRLFLEPCPTGPDARCVPA